MNKLLASKRIAILSALIEGCSLRSTSRMTGTSINTVTKLLVDAGTATAHYQHETMRGLRCNRIECDEIWSFIYQKATHIPADAQGEEWVGDVWTWTAIDAETKLVPCWMVGARDLEFARMFICDLPSRLANRVQLTTDGRKPYIVAVDEAFGDGIDYGMLVKIYGNPEGHKGEHRPTEMIEIRKIKMTGSPDNELISTSYVERQNRTMRMRIRRFTRATNAFSKKLENHEHAVALHFFAYNFIIKHLTLKTTPAQAAGVADRQWTIGELVELIDRYENENSN